MKITTWVQFAVVSLFVACSFLMPGARAGQRLTSIESDSQPHVTLDADAAVHLPESVIPFSEFASPEGKASMLEFQKFYEKYSKIQGIAEQRKMFSEYMQPALSRVRTLYPVDSVPAMIGGVYTDVIIPKDGIQPHNDHRVLINLHGGGFMIGARIMGALESIPVAALGKIKVVTIDYRQGPEYKFPAASEDVTAVYKELLKTHEPRNIGIYGCSAGGALTAEATAWIAKENLPRPGAIGLLCGSAGGWTGGDSGSLGLALMGITQTTQALAPPHPSVANTPYFSDADFNDPMVAPIRSPAVLASFPPTLIITSTRDLALSPAVYTHTQLVKFGVDAELHVWEGMVHGFFTTNPDLPETKEAWDVIVKFFDTHLGGSKVE